MKKNIITIMTLIFAVTLLTGCPKDTGPTNGYDSSGSQESVFTDDVTSGYNRDFQRKNTNNYQSSQNASSNGYASSGNQGYESSSAVRQRGSNGYGSSG